MKNTYEILEGVLKDVLKVEDGSRLPSLESLRASQATSETVTEEFASLVEGLDLTSKDEQVYTAIE